MDCIFCTTPFQLLPAVTIAGMNKEPMDLYIVKQFANASSIAERVRSLHVFQHVKCIDEEPLKKKYIRGLRGTPGRIALGAAYFSADRIARQVLIPGQVYDRMYVSNKEFICRMVYLSLSRSENGISLIAFEDGDGTYASSKTYLPGKADALVRKLLFRGAANGAVSALYVYMPELFEQLNPDHSFPVLRLPSAWNLPEVKKNINYLFDFSDSSMISEKVILLDTLKDQVNFLPGNREKLDEIYQYIFSRFSNDDIIVKKHPRDLTPEVEGRHYYREYHIPFECLAVNMQMDDKVIIAFSSTAVIQPKILTDQEPVVILLNKLVMTAYERYDEVIAFFESVGRLYKKENRFFIPETMEELTVALDTAVTACRGNK